jgi:integrase/recombinase XerD
MSRKRHHNAHPPLDDGSDPLGFQSLLDGHVEALQVRNYSDQTLSNRRKTISRFARWCIERGVTRPSDVTKPIIERYQRHLYHFRSENDKPLSFSAQHQYLSHVRAWFKWLTRKNFLLFNPASEIELPKLGHRLPKAVLSAVEAERVLNVPNTNEPLGLRDRAMLETFYSTGMRRRELAGLLIDDIDTERRTVFIREGKGRKDRMVPIGKRAVAWITRYLEDARGALLMDFQERTLFLTRDGTPIGLDSLSELVRRHIIASGIEKPGSCHLFRHTMATLMLEHGADIRYIQAMLGHAQLSTTEVYTQVSIRKLQQIHDLTHPADHDKEEPSPDDLKAKAKDDKPDDDASGDDDSGEEPTAPTPATPR